MIARVDNPEFIRLIEKGIPIDRLERRMMPLSDWDKWWHEHGFTEKEVEEHDGWWDFSGVGFLGRNERLLEVIISDLEAVESHDTTHSAIALALRNLIIGKHELNPDYVYLGGKKYQQFWSALVGLNDWTLYKILRGSDSVTDIDLNDAFSFTQNERWYLDNGGEQSCPWNCYSSDKEENIVAMSQRNFHYTLYSGTMGIILRKEPFEDGKLEKLMSGYTSWGMYIRSPDVVESFDQLHQEVSSTMQKYLNRDGVIYVPVTGLLPHLIGKHYFFEGKETTHRADPAFLIQALNLEGVVKLN